MRKKGVTASTRRSSQRIMPWLSSGKRIDRVWEVTLLADQRSQVMRQVEDGFSLIKLAIPAGIIALLAISSAYGW
jgi:hypothetical protein